MATLTPQELTKARQLKDEGRSTEDILNYLAGQRVGTPSSLSLLKKEEPFQRPQSVIQETAQDIGQTAAGAFNAFKQGGENIRETAQREDISVGERTAAIGLDIPQTFLNVAGEAIVGAGKVALPQKAEDVVSSGVTSGVQAAMETEVAQDAVNWYEQLSPQQQFRVSELALPAVEVASEIGTGGVFGKLFQSFKRTTPDVKTAITEAVQSAHSGNGAPAVRIGAAMVDDETRQAAVNSLSKAYTDTILENRASVNRKLDQLANNRSFGEETVTKDDLLRQLADEGYVPEIEGQLARFDSSFTDIEQRQKRIMEALEPVLEKTKSTVDADIFIAEVKKAIDENPQIIAGLGRSQAEIDRFFTDILNKPAFGKNLSAKNISEIRKQANKLSRSYRLSNDSFQADTYSVLGKVARKWLDENVPDEASRAANAEYGRLATLLETAEILNNQRVDVGMLGRTLGSYAGTILASTAGLSVAGPAGLVVSGLFANIGAGAVADMIRRKIFSPELSEKIRTVMRKDDALVERLISTASEQDKDTIVRFVLPEAGKSSYRSEIGSGKAIEQPAKTEQLITPVERTAENAIKTPEGNPIPTLTEQALKKLQDAGVDAEAVQKAIVGGLGGYLLLAYTDDNGVLLPAGLAILSAAPQSVRKEILEQASKTKNIKLPETDKRMVAEALASYDTTPMTVNGQIDMSNADIDFRLQELKDKNESGSFTDADAIEARVLLEDRGAFKQSAKTKTTDLLEEANTGAIKLSEKQE